jgi:hypothetical protein
MELYILSPLCALYHEIIGRLYMSKYQGRPDFHLFKRRGGKISSGVQAAPLSELRQGLGVRVKDFNTK